MAQGYHPDRRPLTRYETWLQRPVRIYFHDGNTASRWSMERPESQLGVTQYIPPGDEHDIGDPDYDGDEQSGGAFDEMRVTLPLSIHRLTAQLINA